jgi:hypothetical protein
LQVVPATTEQSKSGNTVPDAAGRGVVVEINNHLRDAGSAAAGVAASDPATRRGDVDDSIKAIVSASTVISALSAKMRTYEMIIFGLNKTIAEHRTSEELSYQRALKAEARAKDAEEQIRRLEVREKTAQDHLDRAMKAVDTSFVFSLRRDHQARARP